MTFDEMVGKILEIFPDALFSEDHSGEINISTGMTLKNNTVIKM